MSARGADTALRVAARRGLTDAVLEVALLHASRAPEFFATNEDKHDYVLSQIKIMGVPDSVANLAVELAVQICKGETLAP